VIFDLGFLPVVFHIVTLVVLDQALVLAAKDPELVVLIDACTPDRYEAQGLLDVCMELSVLGTEHTF
jgi:hypothetical protein